MLPNTHYMHTPPLLFLDVPYVVCQYTHIHTRIVGSLTLRTYILFTPALKKVWSFYLSICIKKSNTIMNIIGPTFRPYPHGV